ncbi:MAG: hypothetical protein EA364_13065 [Balneolaceae bacterium]|nr:MAG: hypothetical protein EA364_13065 [Balneolaceae bacterium]
MVVIAKVVIVKVQPAVIQYYRILNSAVYEYSNTRIPLNTRIPQHTYTALHECSTAKKARPVSADVLPVPAYVIEQLFKKKVIYRYEHE